MDRMDGCGFKRTFLPGFLRRQVFPDNTEDCETRAKRPRFAKATQGEDNESLLSRSSSQLIFLGVQDNMD